MPPELTPRPGAKLPPKLEQLGATEKAAMAEIEEITRDQANALNALATSSMRTAEMCEIMAETLEDIKDILVKVCQGTGMPLPKRIQEQIESKVYDPDEALDDGEGDDGEPVKA